MTLTSNPDRFLDLPDEYADFNTAAAVILPVPYEGGISYGAGTAGGPDAVIAASKHVEFYDEFLKTEPCRMGIATLAPPSLSDDAEGMIAVVQRMTHFLIERNKFIVMLGGDHSVSIGCFKALRACFDPLAVIQLDAHADLRDQYDDSPFSHACVMSRIRELTTDTLQIGIRSMSAEEARRVDDEKLRLCTMSGFRSGLFDIDAALNTMADSVYLTIDVDVFDWSVIRSTGTPEPGGLLWDEALSLLQRIFAQKSVVAIDVVELSTEPYDRNAAFAAAKLIYKMLGFKMAAEIDRQEIAWPQSPRGNLFMPAV